MCHLQRLLQREQAGRVKMKMTGEHQVMNSLAAIAAARHLDIPFKAIKSALEVSAE